MRNVFLFAIVIVSMFLTVACQRPSVPEGARAVNKLPNIFPDYTEVTVPSNICPLNFMMEGCDKLVAKLSVGSMSYVFGEDNKVIMDEEEWQTLRDAAVGKSIMVEVFSETNGSWTAYKPFTINVANDTIDPYLSYRLIQPSYVAYEDLSIVQRNLCSFDERDIYNNQLVQSEKDGQCINCHSYKNNGTDNMLFHARQSLGGTYIVHNGTITRTDLKTDSTISAGVYPSWHPNADLIAFSTNQTKQIFLTNNRAKVEVLDLASDLILYDIQNNTISNISASEEELEVFPCWSADGKTLYYCSAKFALTNDSMPKVQEAVLRHKEIKYSIYARQFDVASKSFGEPIMVFDAAGMNKSATLPRISPDGKYMVFALGNYGCFHVWHPEADIYMLDLSNGQVQRLDGLNSDCSESYPSFSSNGRWVMTASRRDDGNFTRPYISYLDKQGKCHKAFEVPQQDPELYQQLYRSFNRPEFMKTSVTITPMEFAEAMKQTPKKAEFKTK